MFHIVYMQECLRALRTQFPKSLRVKRLNGMYAEAHGHWEEANGIYDEILTEDPAHAVSEDDNMRWDA